MGDIFRNIGTGATIINRSTLNNSMNTVAGQYGDEVAEALRRIAELVQQSGDTAAAENFNAMTEELQRAEPRKSLLRSFWNGTQQALPVLTQMVDISAKIAVLIS